MAISQQLLHSQLSLAHCICQQLPADSRIRHRITQLLEVALDLATCADTPLGPWQQWGHTPVGPSYSACPAQSFPAGASPRQQQTTTTTATAACVNRRCQLYARRIRLLQRRLQCTRPCHIVKEVQQQDGQQQSSQKQDSQQQGPADPTSPRPTPGSAPPKASPAPSRFSVQEAEVHGIAGMSQQEVSVLAAAVRGLSSCYGAVQTAAAVKLQVITAHAQHPEAVAEALVELDAIQDLTLLLSSGNSTCKAAAAATLCNIAWYNPPRSSMLAAGAVPMLSALLWDDDQACRMEAACALSAMTSSLDERVCAAVKAAGGIPRLVGLLRVPDSSDGRNGSNDSSNGGVEGSSSNGTGMPEGCTNKRKREVDNDVAAGDSDRNNSSGGVDGGSPNGSGMSAGCTNWRANAAYEQEDRTADNNNSGQSDSVPNAAAAPDVRPALISTAVTVLGNLAAGSAERRALIATTSGALPGIVACLSSNECRVAALRALLHITAGEPWRLADGLVLAQIKAAGAVDALKPLLNLTAISSGSFKEFGDTLQLWSRLHLPAHPRIGQQQPD